jgi:integrase
MPVQDSSRVGASPLESQFGRCPDDSRLRLRAYVYRRALDATHPARDGCKNNRPRCNSKRTILCAYSIRRLKGKRDRALLALLLACGLRRHEAVALTLDHLQQREEHWAIVDLVGKGGDIRTVPVPDWVRTELDDWVTAAAIDRGRLFRRVNKVLN